jgi:hypothetical protein
MRSSFKLSVFSGIVIVSTIVCADVSAADANDMVFDYNDYAIALKSYVDDTGMVNYKKLKANPQKLEAFLTSLNKLDPNTYDKWPDKDKIAFWLNAYNALTLKVIIDNYPIKSSFFRSRVYPKNSIRQIKGVWNKKTFAVMGRKLTLGHIEHKILRKRFDEPRIHMAMVCAAMGCPPLLNKPYMGNKLDRQLDERTRSFLGNAAKFKMDRKKKRIYLSPIFGWFGRDFVAKYKPEKKLGKHKKKASAILNYIASYLEDDEKEYVLKGNFKIKYLKYDWSLNEQKDKGDKKKQKGK